MERKIKFRGKFIDGTMLYGDFIRNGGRVGIRGKHPEYGLDNWEVEKESVSQFIGLDKNGVEVYEGDILQDALEQEHIAEIYMRPEFIARLILKE